MCGICRQSDSLAPGRFVRNLELVIFKLILKIDILSISCEIALRWMPKDLIGDLVNIDSGNGLVPSGNKSLPEPKVI